MSVYLLPGSEFHDKLRQRKPDIDSTLMYATFDYTRNVPNYVMEWPQVDVGVTGTSDVMACVSSDGTTLFVHSNETISLRDCQMMFYRMSSLVRVDLNNFSTEECTTFRRMFMNCTSIPFVDMSNLEAPYAEDFTEMFSGCSSCTSIDISNLSVPSSAETCVFSDMFKNTTSLRRLSVGKQFAFSTSMSLSNPDTLVIPESDGLWHSNFDEKSYTVDTLPSGVRTTYFAVDVKSNNHAQALVTVQDMTCAAQQIALAVKKYLYWNNVTPSTNVAQE